MSKAKAGPSVNFCSILGRVAIPFVGLYGTLQHAVEAMTAPYRYELSQLGVIAVLIQSSVYPTGLDWQQSRADGAGESAYGELAAVPKTAVAFLQGLFSGPDAPDAHDIATALVRRADTPAGQRPAGVLVANSTGAADANAFAKPIQEQLMDGIAMIGPNALMV